MSAARNSSVADLLEEVHRHPRTALAMADEILSRRRSTTVEQATARWARGMALRELDDLHGADAELTAARLLAVDAGDPTLAARTDVTRSLVLSYLGRSEEALALLDQAAGDLQGADLARLEMQRGLIEHRRGRLDVALDRYLRALPVLEEEGDRLAAARLHVDLGALYVYNDQVVEAIHHCRRGAALGEELGLDLVRAAALHNLGYACGRRGDVVAALEALGQARELYGRVEDSPNLISLRMDLAGVLQEANLLAEARREADAAMHASRRRGHDTELGDAALLAARCRLAAGDRRGAREAADEAATLYRAQDRTAWLPVAELVRLQAEVDDEDAGGSVVVAERAAVLAGTLRALQWRREATEAGLIAVTARLAAGDVRGAEAELGRMPRGSGASPAQVAARSLARARVHLAAGRRASARRALTAGIRLLADNEETIGATELRAHFVDHARGLRQLGLQLASDDGRAREFLSRSESVLGLVGRAARLRAPDDPVLSEMLTELRTISDAALRGDDPSGAAALDARRRRLEAAIRHRTRQVRPLHERFDVPLAEALEALGDRVFVEYAVVGRRIWATSVVRGRARLHELGDVGGVRSEVDALAFAVHRLQRQRLGDASRGAAVEAVRSAAATLDGVLLPDVIRRSTDDLLVVPADQLHGLMWSVLPSVRGRPVSVAPSLLDWHVAASAPAVAGGELLVAGPGLALADAEVRAIEERMGDAVVLTGADAVADRCLAGLAEARVAHFACHGAFRSDNPMFSSLRLDDGELNVYDLETCPSVPRTIVLSACNAAQSRVLTGGAIIGMAAALLRMGVASVVAPLATVNDERSLDLMVRLHEQLASGVEPSAALAAAGSTADRPFDPTAAPFVCFGS